jgi:hypothetical protein
VSMLIILRVKPQAPILSSFATGFDYLTYEF